MSFTRKQTAIVYIDTDKIFFYTGRTGDTYKLDLSADIISDLDLVSEEKLAQLIDSFCKTNNLDGANFEAILVFSIGSIFEKEFIDQSKEEDSQIQEFIDIVPFEDVLSKTYKLGKKTKVVVVNKTLYEALKSALEKKNFSITQVLPYTVLKEINTELVSSVNLAFIASKIDSYKQYSLISFTSNNPNHKEKNSDSKKQNKRVFVLVGIFVVLLIVLGYLIFSTFSSQPTPKKGAEVLPTLTPTPTVVIEENAQLASESANLSETITPTIIPAVSQ